MSIAVIFDLDGTLWDATGSAETIWNGVLANYPDISFRMRKDISEKLMGKTMEEIGDCLFPDISAAEKDSIMADLSIAEVKYLYDHGGVLYEGVKNTMKQLSGSHQLFIVSNCQDGYIQAFLHAHQMEAYFTDFEMSGRTGKGKGENIRILMQRNSINRAVYVGDTESDEKASVSAGIPFIYAEYGFGTANHPYARIEKILQLPDMIKEIECV